VDDRDDSGRVDLKGEVVRICPACGVVNPSGPSGGCPHLQLLRFDGLDDDLERLLAEVAVTRRAYSELTGRLKRLVLEAARDGVAVVETPRRVGSTRADVSSHGPQHGRALDLVHPAGPPAPARTNGPGKAPQKRRRRTGALPVDPRQLELLAQSPPKGDA